MKTATNSELRTKVINILSVLGFIWLIWVRKLITWLQKTQKSVLVVAGFLFIEWLCWHFWTMRWLVSQLILLTLVACLKKPSWLTDIHRTQTDISLASVLWKLLVATKNIEQAMVIQVDWMEANVEHSNDYSAPLLSLPYLVAGRIERPLNNNLRLKYGIIFAEKNQLVFDLSFLTTSNSKTFIERQADAKINDNIPEVADVLRTRAEQAMAEQRIATEEKLSQIVKSDKSKSILKVLMSKGADWGIAIWNLNNDSIAESENALLVRVRLLGNSTIGDLRKQLPVIAKTTRIKVTASELSDKGSANLIFKLHSQYSGKQMTVEQVENNAENGTFELGMGDLGPITLKLPQNDFPATLIGGLSRSGKSTLATMLIVALLSLKTVTGKRTYDSVFVGTVKDEDYKALGWSKKGMYISGNPMDVYHMLKKVDELCTTRKKTFVKSGVINIKEYNHQHPATPLANMLVVIDEYANLLSRAESETAEINGKEVKLSREIERLCVKISQEHISRGCTIILITQNFAKSALGKVYDAVGAKFVGFAEANVASSLDNTGELANAMKGQEQSRKGLFFVNSPDLIPTNDTHLMKMGNGYFQVRTNYLSTEDITRNFDEHYDTEHSYRRNVKDNTPNFGSLPFINLS